VSTPPENWLFSDTPKGAHASALYYSLIKTAKANGLEPYEHLTGQRVSLIVGI